MTTVQKVAANLKQGDIIDVRDTPAYGFGYVWHRLRCDAQEDMAHPENVCFDLDVVDPSIKNSDHYGWPLHIQSNTLVTVFIGNPVQTKYEMSENRFKGSERKK